MCVECVCVGGGGSGGGGSRGGLKPFMNTFSDLSHHKLWMGPL